MLLGARFKPRPIIRALGTAGSLMTIGLSINKCLHWNKPVRGEKTRLSSQKVRSAATIKVEGYQAELSFLPPTQEDKMRLCSEGAPRHFTFKPYCPSV